MPPFIIKENLTMATQLLMNCLVASENSHMPSIRSKKHNSMRSGAFFKFTLTTIKSLFSLMIFNFVNQLVGHSYIFSNHSYIFSNPLVLQECSPAYLHIKAFSIINVDCVFLTDYSFHQSFLFKNGKLRCSMWYKNMIFLNLDDINIYLVNLK